MPQQYKPLPPVKPIQKTGILAPVQGDQMPQFNQSDTERPTIPFKYGEQSFNIPEDEIEGFLQAYPNAEKMAEHPFGWRPEMQGDELMKSALNQPFSQIYEGMQQIRGEGGQEKDVLSGAGNYVSGMGSLAFSPYTMAIQGWKQVPVIGEAMAKTLSFVPELAHGLAQMGFSIADWGASMAGISDEKKIALTSKMFNITPEQAERGLKIWGDILVQAGTVGLVPEVGKRVGETIAVPTAAAKGAFAGAVRGGAETAGEGITGRNLLETAKGAYQGAIGGAITERYGNYPAHRIMASVLKDEIPSDAVKAGLESNVDELSRTGIAQITKERQVLQDMRNEVTNKAANAGGTVDFNKLRTTLMREASGSEGTGVQKEAKTALNEAWSNTLDPIFKKYPDGKVPIDVADIELQTLWDKADKAFRESQQVMKGNEATTASLKGKLYRTLGGQVLAGVIGHPESYPVSGIGENQGMMKEFQAKFEKSVEKMEEKDPRLGAWLARIVLHSSLPAVAGFAGTRYTGNDAYFQAGAAISGLQAFSELWLQNPQNRYELARTINKYQKAGAPLLAGNMIKPGAIALDIGNFYRGNNNPPSEPPPEQQGGTVNPSGTPISPEPGTSVERQLNVAPPPPPGTSITRSKFVPLEGEGPTQQAVNRGAEATVNQAQNSYADYLKVRSAIDQAKRMGDMAKVKKFSEGIQYIREYVEGFIAKNLNQPHNAISPEQLRSKLNEAIKAQQAGGTQASYPTGGAEAPQTSSEGGKRAVNTSPFFIKYGTVQDTGEKYPDTPEGREHMTAGYSQQEPFAPNRNSPFGEIHSQNPIGKLPNFVPTREAQEYARKNPEVRKEVDKALAFTFKNYPNVSSLVDDVVAIHDENMAPAFYDNQNKALFVNLAYINDAAGYSGAIAHELEHAVRRERTPIENTYDFNESTELGKRGFPYPQLPIEYREYAVQKQTEAKYYRQAFPEMFKKDAKWHTPTLSHSPMTGDKVEMTFGNDAALLSSINRATAINQTPRYTIEFPDGGQLHDREGKGFATKEKAMAALLNFIKEHKK